MRKEELDGQDVFVVRGFLSPAECDALIARGESAGFADAPVIGAGGPEMAKEVRNNTRVMIDDHKLAVAVWDRAREFVPARVHEWRAVGVNERFRLYRYDVGQKFALHSDGAFFRSDVERSHVTFMVYLNDDFQGGETVFYGNSSDRLFAVRPERGMALGFAHRRLHEGAEVIAGRKYVARTDVMYRLDSAEAA